MLVIMSTFSMVLPVALSHGCMTKPNPRGSLTDRSMFIEHAVDQDAPIDYFPHFPAGPRNRTAGSALERQRENAGNNGWYEFQPENKSIPWRASVCGDGKFGPYEHLKGGRYYYNGKIVATYRQGGVMNVEVRIIAHHLGFVELRICDVGKCPGAEISEECFQMGHCYTLERARVKECQTGYSKKCGPIDRKRKSRWYLPCYGFEDKSGNIAKYGVDGTMRFKIPGHLHCEHCVVHWIWTTANTCNPPGVIDYYKGPDRPRGWGRCRGQAGAFGGVALNQGPCGGLLNDSGLVPEEYMSCADVRILPRAVNSTANNGMGVNLGL